MVPPRVRAVSSVSSVMTTDSMGKSTQSHDAQTGSTERD
jgi:hypothetical protein